MLANSSLLTLGYTHVVVQRDSEKQAEKNDAGSPRVHPRSDSAGARLHPRTGQRVVRGGSSTRRAFRRWPAIGQSPNAHSAIHATRSRAELTHRGDSKLTGSTASLRS